MKSPVDPYEPTLDLPEFVGQKRNREWSTKEARQMLDWTLRRLEVVPALLRWLDIDPDQPCSDLLVSVGARAGPILSAPNYSTPGPNFESTVLKGHPIKTDIGPLLSPAGEAVAYDLALVIALCLRRSIPNLRWTIGRGPKTFVSLNRPLLEAGPPGSGFDPVLIGINTASHAIRTGDVRRWADIYRVWLDNLAPLATAT